jgi:hypothetical protein
MSQTNEEQPPNGDLPVWAKLVWAAAVKWGLWSVVALALGYVLVGDVRADVRALRTEHSAMSAILQRLEFYQRQTCFNTAKDEAQRAGCVFPSDAR